MQGIFNSEFRGKKSDIDRLLQFIDEKSKTDSMYKIINELVDLPRGYFKKDDDEILNITIGLSSSCNINFFDNYTYFGEVSKAVPELYMKGEYSMLDFDGTTTYVSEAGSSYVEEEIAN